MRSLYLLCFVCACVAPAQGDVYLHNPRGSNNRLNENTANRRNGNRAFDSQNNNRGGYNVGDKTADRSGNNADKQYQMQFFSSGVTGKTFLDFEWTAQHGCGGNENTDPNKLNCNIVIQYMCQDPEDETAQAAISGLMRDGTNTQTPNFWGTGWESKPLSAFNAMEKQINEQNRNKVLQEPYKWHHACRLRERNKGLFTADQNVRNNKGATATRQNPKGKRSGFECAEERDYYPYWHPTPWKDIAVLTTDVSKCADFYTKESFNVKPKGQCVEKYTGTNDAKTWSKANNPAACTTAEGTWTDFTNYLELAPTARQTNKDVCVAAEGTPAGVTYIWGKRLYSAKQAQDECLVALAAPKCEQAPFSRSNHLGNGKDLEPVKFTWEIPYFPSKTPRRCVARLRYNMTTDDYNPDTTTAAQNNQDAVIENNPEVSIGLADDLQLALNTAQTGRTFQDRTHVMWINPREAALGEKNIYNLNVRGKRGNIVQTYPAVEYDFVPTNLELKANDDLVHIQWTGSNSHNNQPPGGDGQTGDAGEGRRGTDRSNIVETVNRNVNFPMVMEKSPLLENINIVHCLTMQSGERNNGETNCVATPSTMNKYDKGVLLGSAGRTPCLVNDGTCTKSVDASGALNPTLDNASASFPGVVASFKKAAVHHYMCSRNNNFSNRSQKGTITVK